MPSARITYTIYFIA